MHSRRNRHIRRSADAWFAIAAGLLASMQAAFAQGSGASDADMVFRIASRSVVSVHVFDPQSVQRRRVSFGSGVTIGPARVATNCHVLAPGLGDGSAREIVVEVKEPGQRTGRPARLGGADPARDLCVLDVPGLEAASATFGASRSLRVGQVVFAVGSPHGLELTLSGGLISSLRKTGDEPIIQTDASMSAGSSGGGLFDAQGRLIGITSFGVHGGQNLNFALPVEWVKDTAVRSISSQDFAAIAAQARKLVQGGTGARGVTAGGGRWAHTARAPQGYDVYVDMGRLSRANAQAQVWVLHNFDSPVASAAGAAYRSRVLLTEIDCAGGRWTLWHAALYTDHFALGRRLSAEDFSPSEADYRPAAPGAAMDKVRIVACR